jgi:hypothetical protein
MSSPIIFKGLTLDQANTTAKYHRDHDAEVTVNADGTGFYTVEVVYPASSSDQPPAAAPPSFSQIADAMQKIAGQLNADPPPSPALKQSLNTAYQTLRAALDAIAAANSAGAVSSVGDAAKQLQGIIDSGTANADAIQQILASLGISKTPAAAAAQPPAKPPASDGGTAGGSSAAPSLSDRVPIPPRNQINAGLSACKESTMLAKFGSPGNLTADCSAATGVFLKRVRQGFDVGPFKVTGLDYAVESLSQVFSDVRKDNQQLYDQVRNEGMLCVRARRHNPGHFSNHSWGTAIDIFFGTDVVPQGVGLAHRGNLLLAPYFNQHGWYWGAGFSSDSVDSMHFELADEIIAKIPSEPMFDAATVAPAPAAPAAPAPAGFQADPASAPLLGDILALIGSAQPVKQRFAGVTFAGTLSTGQLVYQSELQLDTDGWPDGKDRGDSTWRPDTALQYADGSFVNANAVPYFVLPGNWFAQFAIKVGDLGAIVYGDKLALAVFADVGPKNKLGEASLKLFRQLGEERLRLNGQVINSGMAGGVITIVFPGSKPAMAYQNESSLLNYIHDRGSALFAQLGGHLPDGFDEA